MQLDIDTPDLEKQESTQQLQQIQRFQELLQYLTEAIRDGLDDDKLFTIITQKLVDLLQLNCCQIEFYNPCITATIITYEYSSILPIYQGLTREIADFTQIYQSLLQKQIWQSLEIVPTYNSILELVSQLACPIFNHQEIFGNIWIIKVSETQFTPLEISFIQQIANKCAIVIRQSQLLAKTKSYIKEIENQKRQKYQFIKQISQELRTPITNINLAIQTLESLITPANNLNAEIVNHLLQILYNECERENKLLEDILTLAYFKINPQPPTFMTINLLNWLPPIIQPFRDVTNCQQQYLYLDIPAEIPALSTDIQDLEQIITLILNQACQCTPQNQSITVTAHLNAEMIELKVNMSGVEIPESELSQVFEPFYCIPKHSPWQAQNTGLELTLIKTMVQRLNGLINVTSTNNQTALIMKFPF